jgi:hypothetical protein
LSISAFIARTIGDRRIAINAGTDAGVKIGDLVKVVRMDVILDPITKQKLGTVSTTLLQARVTLVSTTYAVATTFDLVTPPRTSFALAALAAGEVVRVTETPSEVDWKTVFVKAGTPVVVETPTSKAPESPES